jgi:hypothetical protein
VAYLTCPWCLTPQLVADDSIMYRCFTCYGEIGFYPCPECGYAQTVNKKWVAFSCGKCDAKVTLPHRWSFTDAAKAYQVRGMGKSWPPM